MPANPILKNFCSPESIKNTELALRGQAAVDPNMLILLDRVMEKESELSDTAGSESSILSSEFSRLLQDKDSENLNDKRYPKLHEKREKYQEKGKQEQRDLAVASDQKEADNFLQESATLFA